MYSTFLSPQPLRFGMQRIWNHARASCLNRDSYDLRIGMITPLLVLVLDNHNG